MRSGSAPYQRLASRLWSCLHVRDLSARATDHSAGLHVVTPKQASTACRAIELLLGLRDPRCSPSTRRRDAFPSIQTTQQLVFTASSTEKAVTEATNIRTHTAQVLVSASHPHAPLNAVMLAACQRTNVCWGHTCYPCTSIHEWFVAPRRGSLFISIPRRCWVCCVVSPRARVLSSHLSRRALCVAYADYL